MAQQIYEGISHLDEAVKGCRKLLLVCDASFPFLNIRPAIENLPVACEVFNQFSSNPLYNDVCKGVKLFRQSQCDAILAVGGGSAIDVAKCIKLYCQMSDDRLYLEQAYRDTGVRLIAVPTTAGTGSESTRYAVIYYDGKKQSVTHASIIPDTVILDSTVLKTLPLYQKKCTMMDALCQGIESWWSVHSTDESKVCSRQAVETIMKWWQPYINDNSDEAALQIMRAANTAGRAINITQTTAAHAFSYKITSMYNLPHGHAVAVCLPEIWQFMTVHPEKCIDTRGEHYLQAVFEDIAGAMGSVSVAAAITRFCEMMTRLDLGNPHSLNRAADLHTLVSSVNPVRLKNNPVELDSDSISYLYDLIIK